MENYTLDLRSVKNREYATEMYLDCEYLKFVIAA